MAEKAKDSKETNPDDKPALEAQANGTAQYNEFYGKKVPTVVILVNIVVSIVFFTGVYHKWWTF
jgi:hypothetical protein